MASRGLCPSIFSKLPTQVNVVLSIAQFLLPNNFSFPNFYQLPPPPLKPPPPPPELDELLGGV